MKRIDIFYGGQQYSVGGRDPVELRAEIESKLTSSDGNPWLEVNDGEGDRRRAFLLISPGVPLSVVPIPDPDA